MLFRIFQVVLQSQLFISLLAELQYYKLDIGRFYTRGRIIRLDELGPTFVVRLVMRLKTGTLRIIRLDELSLLMRLERRSSKGRSSRRIMRLVPVFVLETHNQTNYKY